MTKPKDINQFPFETHKFIEKKSIHHTNQVILSFDEINEFKQKFESYKLNSILKPDLLVIFKNKIFEKNINNLKNFEIIFKNYNYIVLTEKK